MEHRRDVVIRIPIPDWRLGLLEVALLLGPAFLWPRSHQLSVEVSPAWGDVAVLGGLISFPAGRVLVGASLRPRGRALRGAAIAAILYVVVGLGWWVFLAATALGMSVTDLPDAALGILLWPIEVAMYAELFGLAFQ